MRAFGDAALGYPTVLFSFALLVVTGYWGTAPLGGLDVDALHRGHGGRGRRRRHQHGRVHAAAWRASGEQSSIPVDGPTRLPQRRRGAGRCA